MSHNIKAKDTTEIVCTVEHKTIILNGDSATVNIFVSEYDGFLHILSNVCKNINMDDIRSINTGDTIVCQIESKMVKQLNDKKGFCSILALKIENNDIFSLNDYNVFLSNDSYPTKIAAVILALFFLVADLYNIILLKRQKR